MKRAPWLYTLMQIALWSIHGVLISYAQRYLAGMGMRDSAIGLLLGGATAAGFVLQPLLAAVCDRSRLTSAESQLSALFRPHFHSLRNHAIPSNQHYQILLFLSRLSSKIIRCKFGAFFYPFAAVYVIIKCMDF